MFVGARYGLRLKFLLAGRRTPNKLRTPSRIVDAPLQSQLG